MRDSKGTHIILPYGDVMVCRHCGKLVWPTVTMVPVVEELKDPRHPKLETLYGCHFCGKESSDINEVVKYYKNRREINEFSESNGEHGKGSREETGK